MEAVGEVGEGLGVGVEIDGEVFDAGGEVDVGDGLGDAAGLFLDDDGIAGDFVGEADFWAGGATEEAVDDFAEFDEGADDGFVGGVAFGADVRIFGVLAGEFGVGEDEGVDVGLNDFDEEGEEEGEVGHFLVGGEVRGAEFADGLDGLGAEGFDGGAEGAGGFLSVGDHF